MIDTDKYEGHYDGVWTLHPYTDYNCELRIDGDVVASTHTDEPTTQLIADASLLLAEVKRLREENERLREAIRECDSMKCTWLYEGTYKEMIE